MLLLALYRGYSPALYRCEFHQILDNRQPEPKPAVLSFCRSVSLTEPLEKMRQKIKGSPFTGVRNSSFHMRWHKLGKHANLTAFGRELNRVSKKVPKHLVEAAAKNSSLIRLEFKGSKLRKLAPFDGKR
jgi:hypothetical protein